MQPKPANKPINIDLDITYEGSIKGRKYYYATDNNTYDGTTALGFGHSRDEAIEDLVGSIECPNCKEISLVKMDSGMYECELCHTEVQFSPK